MGVQKPPAKEAFVVGDDVSTRPKFFSSCEGFVVG